MDETRPAMTAARRGPAWPAPGRRPPWLALHRRRPWLLPAGLVLIVAGLTINVLVNGPLVGLDNWIYRVVEPRSVSPAWAWLADGRFTPAELLVDLGGFHIATPVLGLVAVVLAARRRTWRPLLTAAAGVALLLGTVIPAKILIRRPHPRYPVLPHGALGSFPSGHTATATVCYVLAVLLLTAGARPRTRRVALACAWVLCAAVGLALVWCDYHWLTDVVASWALSWLILMLTTRLAGGRPGPAGPGLGPPADRPARARAGADAEAGVPPGPGYPAEVRTILPTLPPAPKRS